MFCSWKSDYVPRHTLHTYSARKPENKLNVKEGLREKYCQQTWTALSLISRIQANSQVKQLSFCVFLMLKLKMLMKLKLFPLKTFNLNNRKLFGAMSKFLALSLAYSYHFWMTHIWQSHQNIIPKLQKTVMCHIRHSFPRKQKQHFQFIWKYALDWVPSFIW